MGYVSHPLPTCLFILFQGQCQGVEVPGEPAQFVGRGHRDPRFVLAGSQPPGSHGKCPDRAHQSACKWQGKPGSQQYQDLVLQTTFPLATAFKEAVTRRKPISEDKPKSVAAEAIQDLARTCVEEEHLQLPIPVARSHRRD